MILLSDLSPFIIVVCKKWTENLCALASNVQVGDNWSSTSTSYIYSKTYKPRGWSRKWSGDASRYYEQKNIADWCSNDRKILVTPSFFVVRPFLF
jgi:hypothetical protein